jgi:tetrahydromethanopterin S-methyltransferase subunit G
MAEKEKKETTLGDLALMMGRGFNDVGVRLDKVDGRLDSLEASVAVLTVDMKDVKGRLDKIDEKIGDLVTTLDAFLKRLTAHEEEFEIMKKEMKIMKEILREKLHVDVDSLK